MFVMLLTSYPDKCVLKLKNKIKVLWKNETIKTQLRRIFCVSVGSHFSGRMLRSGIAKSYHQFSGVKKLPKHVLPPFTSHSIFE